MSDVPEFLEATDPQQTALLHPGRIPRAELHHLNDEPHDQ